MLNPSGADRPVAVRAVFGALIAGAALVFAGCMLRGSGGYAGNGVVRDGEESADANPGTTEDPAGDSGAAGSPGGAGGEGGEDSMLRCSSLPFGCVCSPREPSQVTSCDPSSVVKVPGQDGVCCQNAFRCICAAYECVLRTPASCVCQLAGAGGPGTRVAECGPAMAGDLSLKCCRGNEGCACGTAACLPTEAEVPDCRVEDLLTCALGDDRVETCEEAGR